VTQAITNLLVDDLDWWRGPGQTPRSVSSEHRWPGV